MAPRKGPTDLDDRFGRVNHFLTGRIATSAVGAGAFRAVADATDVNWSFMLWPRPKVATPDIYATGMALLPPTAKREQAWAWMSYLYQDSRLARFLGTAPVVLSEAATWVADCFKSRPGARPQLVVQGVEQSAIDPIWNHPKSNDMWKQDITPGIARILGGETAAADELSRMKGRFKRSPISDEPEGSLAGSASGA